MKRKEHRNAFHSRIRWYFRFATDVVQRLRKKDELPSHKYRRTGYRLGLCRRCCHNALLVVGVPSMRLNGCRDTCMCAGLVKRERMNEIWCAASTGPGFAYIVNGSKRLHQIIDQSVLESKSQTLINETKLRRSMK